MPRTLAKPTLLVTVLALGALACVPAQAAARESARRSDDQVRAQARPAARTDHSVREFVREHWTISLRLARLLGFVSIPDPNGSEPPIRGRVIDGPDPIGNSEGDSGGSSDDRGSSEGGTGIEGGGGSTGSTGGDGGDSGGSGEGD